MFRIFDSEFCWRFGNKKWAKIYFINNSNKLNSKTVNVKVIYSIIYKFQQKSNIKLSRKTLLEKAQSFPSSFPSCQTSPLPKRLKISSSFCPFFILQVYPQDISPHSPLVWQFFKNLRPKSSDSELAGRRRTGKGEKLDETREGEIRTENSSENSIATERSRTIHTLIFSLFLPLPTKRKLLSFRGKNVRLCNGARETSAYRESTLPASWVPRGRVSCAVNLN